MKTVIQLPPLISQLFSRYLLSFPCPKFREGVHTLEKMINESKKIFKKVRNHPVKKERCKKIMSEIVELYERAKIKEKERESQKDHKTQGFGYSVGIYQKMDYSVYRRLVFGRKKG